MTLCFSISSVVSENQTKSVAINRPKMNLAIVYIKVKLMPRNVILFTIPNKVKHLSCTVWLDLFA